MPIKLNTFQRHYILYSKGWYGEYSYEKLKKIHATICGIPERLVENVEKGRVWTVLVEIMIDIVQKVHPTIFYEWLVNLPVNRWGFLKPEKTFDDMIVETVGRISTLQIHRDYEDINQEDFVDLGPPDYEAFGSLMTEVELESKREAVKKMRWGNEE